MKLFVNGFILFMLVASTLGAVLPMPLQENANPLPAEDVHSLQENAKGGMLHNDIGRQFLRRHNIGSCKSQYVNCWLNKNVGDNIALCNICYWFIHIIIVISLKNEVHLN